VLDRDVAIKCMLVDFGVDEDARARFQQEARSAARLQHPNIVTIYEFGEKDDSPYLIMQFLGGNDLEELMRRDTPLGLADRLEIVAQLCDGLAFAHERGVVHRDIKPGNVRVLDDGSVKLLDFGIAKVANADATAGVFAGSPAYASPEQLSLESVDGRSDLFSVGVLAYELLTGRQPFTGDSAAAVAYQILNEEPPSPRSLVPALPEKLEAILTRALQKKPDARWESAQELGEAFREVASELAEASPVSRPAGQRTIVRGTRRNKVGNLDVQAGLGRPESSDQVGETPLVGSGPAVEAAPKPRNRVAAVGALALVAALAVGGFYAFRVLGGDGGSAPAQVEVTPPVETPAPPVLTLEVTSTPAGAVVTRDGEDTGQTTPASFPLEEPYPELIAVSLVGYVSDTRELPPVEGQSLTMEFELTVEATYGRVSLSGPYAFEVFIGRQRVGERATRHDITWNTGSTTLRIRSAEVFLDSSYTVTVTEGEPAAVTAPALGSLTVFSRPGDCEIFLGSVSLGFPPITDRPVAPGTYTVRRECTDQRQNNDRSVTVASGQNESAPFVPVQ
jgi:serine/threonine-protein kinase